VTEAPDRSDRWRALTLFAVLFTIYCVCPIKNGFDSGWTVPVAVSLLREGNADLDEYAPSFPLHEHGLWGQGSHTYNYYPLGPSLVALPFVAIADGFCRVMEHLGAGQWHPVQRWRTGFDRVGLIEPSFWDTLELIVGSFCVALCAALLFLVARRSLSPARALLVALVFALCTSALSIASRALWQHGPSMLFLTATLLLLVRAKQDERGLGLAGATVALAYLMRPTNALSVLAFSVYVAIVHRRRLWRFLAGGLVVGAPWIAFNLHTYGNPLAPYYAGDRLGGSRFLEGLAVNLVSPARGLLVYSPILLFAGYGLWRKARRGQTDALDWTLATVIVAHWVGVSNFHNWWAGHSYGPRFMSDMLPFLAYFLIPSVAELRWGSLPQRAEVLAFAMLALLSLAVHVRGATSQRPFRWNDGPPNIDQAPSRAWDWRHPQFLADKRTPTRFLSG
jgi:hypothetical protein